MKDEYEATLRCDLFDTVFFDYEGWFYHGKLVLSKIIKVKVVAVYRGWMMNPEKYRRFYNTLLNWNIELITSPEEYAAMLTGGICVKEYLNLRRYGDDDTNEFRVFYINHKVASMSRNSWQTTMTKEPPRELIDKYRNRPSVYYSVDFAELEDGRWVITKVGDGSVSGLSESQDYKEYFRKVYECFNEEG